MDTLQWLLALHVTGAFLFLGGSFCAGTLSALALRSKLPSEIALFLGLARVAVIAVVAGTLMTLVLGLWLVHEAGYSYGRPWIVASLVLLVAAGALGGRGGRNDRQTRLLAERLAADGDVLVPELQARLRDPRILGLSWLSGAFALAILGLMIWKPGG